jgi:hypothetical protein
MAQENKRNDQSSRVPENDPSKAMDSKREVAQSNDEKTDQDFPGYPHYPAKEDIMDQRTDSHRVDMDVENLPNSRNASGVSQRFTPAGDARDRSRNNDDVSETQDDLDMQTGNDADITDEELAMLNSTNAEIGIPQNVSNEELNTDLDIPGSELDDEMEDVGEEDEENNYYSVGGDRHENLEEDIQE